jgi:hypothetical protein
MLLPESVVCVPSMTISTKTQPRFNGYFFSAGGRGSNLVQHARRAGILIPE